MFCLCLCFLSSFVRLLFLSFRACEAGSCVILLLLVVFEVVFVSVLFMFACVFFF